jgi:hypothetical protein
MTPFGYELSVLSAVSRRRASLGGFLLLTLGIHAVKHLSARYSAPEPSYGQASYPILTYMGWQQATFGELQPS